MNILQNFYNLWHNHDLFNNFLKNVWNFNEPFLVSNDWDWCLLISVDNLKDLLDMIDVSDNFFEFFHNYGFLNCSLNLLDSFVLILDLNDSLIFFYNFLYSFYYDWNLNDLLDNFFNISVNVNKLRHNFLNFIYFWYLDNNLSYSLNFMDFRNSYCFLYYFFDNLLGSNNLLYNWLDWNDLFSFNNNLFNFFTDIRYLFDYLLYSLVNDYFFLNSHDLMNSDLLGSLGNNFFHDLWYLNNFLNNLGYRNNSLDDFLDWDRNLNRNNNLSFNLNWLDDLNCVINKFLNFQLPGNLLDNFDNFLNNNVIIDNFFLIPWHLNKFIDNPLNNFLYLNIYVLNSLNLYRPLLYNWLLYNPLNLLDPLLDNNFGHYPFHNLYNLNNLLDHPGHNNNLLDNPLNLNDFGDLNHFLYNLLNRNLNLPDPIHMPYNLDDFFLNILDGLRHLNIVVDYLLDLYDLWLPYDLRVPQVDFLYDGVLGPLDDGLLDDLLHPYQPLDEDGDLDDSLDLLHYFVGLDHGSVAEGLDLADLLLQGDLLADYGHLVRLADYCVCLHDALYYLRYLHYLLDRLDYWDRFLYYTLHYLVPHLDVVLYLFRVSVLYFPHDLLYYLLHLYYLRNLHYLLYDLLYYHLHLHYLLHDSLLGLHNHLLNYLYFSYLMLNVVNYFFNLDDLLNLHNSIDEFLYSYNFGNLLDDLDYSFNNMGDFDHPLDNSFDGNYFLDDVCNDYWHLERNVDYSFNLFDLLNLDNFLDYLFDSYDMRHFYDTINNFLDYFLDLDYFRDYPEDF